ncbi:MAG: VOC family protein [Bacteroidetes bacterium]|nr:VOC family protein [Bacteroidota bacterium]
MASVGTYLNFPNQTETAFNFYKSVFGGEFSGDGISRFGEAPAEEGAPPMSDELKNKVMHVALPILGGHLLMGTDAPEEMGFKVQMGNNSYICLSPDTYDETRRLFAALSEGGKVEMDLKMMFWGSLYGSCCDKFGVQWMFDCVESAT